MKLTLLLKKKKDYIKDTPKFVLNEVVRMCLKETFLITMWITHLFTIN